MGSVMREVEAERYFNSSGRVRWIGLNGIEQ